MAIADKKDSGLIYNIQFLRAVAALIVVYGHSSCNRGLNTGICLGSSGVDLFFIISGFIICFITFSDSSQFLKRRIIRIVPFYWTATFALFLVATVAPSVLRTVSADVPTLVYSLFFIPHDTPHGPYPLMLLGWTLNYEMYFYVIYAAALTISHKHAYLLCAAAILAVLAVTDTIAPASQALGYYGRTVVLEFIFGMIVFHAFRLAPQYLRQAKRKKTIFVALIALLIVAFALLILQDNNMPPEMRVLYAGVPAAFVVISALLLENLYGFAVHNRTVLLLGEASYVLYLVHPYVIYSVLRVGLRNSVQWPLWAKLPMVLVLMALASAVAVAIHFYFERPVMAALRRKFLHRPPPVIFETDGMKREPG
jgi:exopolysaccharide production protein ExoZ